MDELPITFNLMPMAMLLGLLFILVSITMLYKANKYIAKEMMAAGMVIILLAFISLLVHQTITMFTPRQAVALFIMVIGVPIAIAVLRSRTWKLLIVKPK